MVRAIWMCMCKNQGNLKGESVVAAILPSRMEVSYCTSGFFVAKPPNNFVKRGLPFPRELKSHMHTGYRAVNHMVLILCADCDE